MLWVVERRSMGNLGPLLFSTNLNGEKLHKVTVCRQTKATTRRVGIDLLRKGGRTLGNTFAKRKLDEGASVELVVTFLGLCERKSAEPL